MTGDWTEHYPDPAILKVEIGHMLDAFTEALLATIPPERIRGTYAKGSALKDWQSPLDYVPEISDVDIHILLADEADLDRYIGTMEQAMAVTAAVEDAYRRRVPEPLHVPRPQLMSLAPLQLMKDYLPSPVKMVTVLYGEDYHAADYSRVDAIRAADCRRMLAEEATLAALPMQVVDRPAQYMLRSLGAISWHVSPAAPRVLDMLGTPPEEAWSINRSRAVELLAELGEDRLLEDFSSFYLEGWEFILSRYEDSAAGRRSLIAGARAIARGIEVARDYQGRRGGIA